MSSQKQQGGVWQTLKPFVNGGASGITATCVIQPIDIVKVRPSTRLHGRARVTAGRAAPDGWPAGLVSNNNNDHPLLPRSASRSPAAAAPSAS
jgi:Mitochondrial carrier protein